MVENDALIGRYLGGFRMESLIGQGGMARVYYGWDERLQRPVAIKIIGERFRNDPAFVERFLREARVVASWRHPNILQVYTSGEEDGYSYYVMEYVRGLDLQQLLRRQTQAGHLLPQGEVVRIGRAIASAIDYAHGRGVVHRDIKPSNVIVAEDGRVVLADFGLALHAATGTLGEVFGSPHYIAPEQAQNSSLAVTQSDIYSFGIILYEMLTGYVPFDDPSPTALALQHINQPPPSPRTFNPALSQNVENVLLKTLRKIPQERYSTAHELMDTLEDALRTGVADTQPLTMRVLPTTVPAANAAGGEPTRQAQPDATTLGNHQPNAYPPGKYPLLENQPQGWQATNTVAGVYPYPSMPARPANQPPIRRFLTCGVLLLAVLFLTVATVFATNLSGGLPGIPVIFGPSRTPQATEPLPATGSLPPTETPTFTPEPSLTFSPEPTLTPSATEDLAATQTALAPTPTDTAVPTLTFTATLPPPTPTDTPIPPTDTAIPPTDTPIPGIVFDLALVKRGGESLFVVNNSEAGFPLERLTVGEGPNRVPGDDWDVRTLQPGRCVAVWEKGRRPPVPEGLDCDWTGDDLRRNGANRFWLETFNVFFDNELIGVCEKEQPFCEINFIVPQP